MITPEHKEALMTFAGASTIFPALLTTRDKKSVQQGQGFASTGKVIAKAMTELAEISIMVSRNAPKSVTNVRKKMCH
jgi:hypothetical protein